tara:strand:+ start:2810 stop:2950 length:141 start_codon:yes stop_codon:yes gene_type:complete
MSKLIIIGLFIEVVIVFGAIFLVKQLKKKQKIQPALSNEIIKNLKF